MRTWDGTKATGDVEFSCYTCDWEEWNLGVVLHCPECGNKVHKNKVYICPYCGVGQAGVEQYNMHTLEHYECYEPLVDMPDVVAAMRKYAPWSLRHTIEYFNEHGIEHNLGEGG